MMAKSENRKRKGKSEKAYPFRSGKWALLIFLALLPVGLLGLIAFRIGSDAMRELVAANNLAAARGAADIVNESLQRRLKFELSLAETPTFIEAVVARDEATLERFLRHVTRINEPIFRSSVYDSEGILLSDFPHVLEAVSRDFTDTDWYQGVSESWEPSVTGVHRLIGDPDIGLIAIAVPIFQEAAVVGILLHQYRLGNIGENLRYFNIGERGTSFLLDPEGNVAAHSELDPEAEIYSDYASLPVVRRALRGQPFTGEYRNPRSEEWSIATFWPFEISGQYWVVVAEQPLADAYSPIRRIALHIGAAGVILALMAVAVVVVLWRTSERNRYLNKALEVRNRSLQKLTSDLERSNKELEEFAYVASHDLQEPLRMVASYTQLLASRYRGQLDETADKFIHYAVDGAKRMQQLIEDLLKYSRVGTQRKPFEPVSFTKIFEQVLSNLKIAISETDAEVTADELPVLMADPTQMVQLFQNLIGNAIKFRGEEAPRIHVSAHQEGEAWIFSVRDNGIGIDPEDHERIFLISQRLPSERSVSGSGLGLPLCKKIVERHSGRMWLESEKGSGSTFYFTIPAEEDTLT